LRQGNFDDAEWLTDFISLTEQGLSRPQSRKQEQSQIQSPRSAVPARMSRRVVSQVIEWMATVSKSHD
jgi:hypothetical protein